VATKAKKAAVAIDAADFAKAIGHPMRLRIWTILFERKASAIELSREFGCESPEVSYHIKVLKECKVVEEAGHKRRRGATERFYRAVVRPMVDADGLAALPAGIANSLIGQAMARVVDDFTAAGKAELFKEELIEMVRLPLHLDAEGREEAQEGFDELLEKLHNAQARSDDRRVKSGEKGVHYTAAQMCFPVPKGSKP
jgi:DNA-binding transcriptional ArsR family regulator